MLLQKLVETGKKTSLMFCARENPVYEILFTNHDYQLRLYLLERSENVMTAYLKGIII